MVFTSREKAFCVLEYARTNSNKTVQRVFVRKLPKKSPTAKQIWCWKKKFEDEGCLCRAKGSGRPATAEGKVERIRQTLLRSPKMSTRRTSVRTLIPPTTVWWVVRKPYKLQVVQAITAADKRKRKQFLLICKRNLKKTNSMNVLCSVMRPHFIRMGKVNWHNVRIWGEENLHATIGHERDSPKVNVFCAISKNHVHGPFFFEGNVTGDVYLQMLQNWLMDELIANKHEDFIYQQDGVTHHWKLTVRAYFNDNLPRKWIGRARGDDNVMLKWPPRST